MIVKKLISLSASVLLLTALLYSCSPSSAPSSPTEFTAASIPQGALFAAASKPGKVYRYIGADNWAAISGELGASVDVLAVHNGKLYAAVSLNDIHGPSIVFRYSGGTTWSPITGEFNAKITAITMFQGRMYAAAINPLWNKGQLIRIDDDMKWSIVVDSNALSADWWGFQTLYATSDYLYIGASNSDYIARFDGVGIEQTNVFSGAGIRAMEVFRSELYAGAMDGWIYKTSDGMHFAQQHTGLYPANVLSMKTFRDELYIGLSSSASGSAKAQLHRWNNGDMQLIWENSAASAGDGIISMATNGTILFFGVGAEAQLPDDSSNGVVYAYDGQNVTAISGRLGAAVTQLIIHELSLPSLEIQSALVGPSPMLAGGTFLAYITLKNAEVSPSYLYESGFKAVTGLPTGWYAEFIDIGTYGVVRERTPSIGPGETTTIVVAVTVPCGTSAGIYTFAPKLIYGYGDVENTYMPSRDYTSVHVEIKDNLQGAQMASYRHAQAAVRQIRALDRNIENGVITTAINLTFLGIDGTQKTVTIYAAGGRAYRYLNTYSYFGDEYTQDDYYSDLTAYAYAEKSETHYQNSTGDYSFSSLLDSRPYYLFDLSAIPAGAAVINVQILFFTGYGYPLSGDFYVDIYSMENNPATALPQIIFEDANNGILYADNVLVRPDTTITVTPGANFLSAFSAAVGGTFAIGLKLEDTLSSTDRYEDINEYYSYRSSTSSIYLSYGKNPTIYVDTIRYTDPDEALYTALNFYRDGKTPEANELATYINEKYYSIGFWGLAPGRDECNEGNGGNPK